MITRGTDQRAIAAPNRPRPNVSGRLNPGRPHMPEPLKFEYQLTEDILRRGLRRAPVLTTLAHATILTSIGIAGLIGLSLLGGPLLPVVAIFCFSVIGVIALLLWLLAYYQWRARAQLRQWASERLDQTIRWRLTDESFTIEMPEQSREVDWRDVIRFTEETDFWVLAIRKGPELMLPVECLTRDIRKLIRSRTARVRKKRG